MQIGQTVVTISQFWISQDVGSHKLEFLKFYILTIWTAKKDELHHCAKFCRNRLNHGGDSQFSIFQNGGRRHLGFWNFEFLTVETVKMFEVLHRAKFGENRLDRGWDMAIFQDSGRRHLGFWKFQIFNGRGGQEGRIASSCQISSKSAQLRLRYGVFWFLKMAVAAILDFLNF